MVEAGVMRLVEDGEICVLVPWRDDKTVARVKCSVTKPTLNRDQEASLIDVLRERLKEEL